MAGDRHTEQNLKDELTCSICCELFREPVMLECMHHFCKACILRFWQGYQKVASCPQCRRESPSRTFRTSYLVARVVERVRQCITEQQRRKLQKQLEDALKSHQIKLEDLVQMKRMADQRIYTIKENSEALAEKVRVEFKCLHQILEEEERATLAELGKEKEGAVLMLKMHIQQLEEGISELKKTMESIHQAMSKMGDEFLLEVEDLKTRRIKYVETQPIKNLELHKEKYTGPFQYKIWKRMLKSIHPAPSLLTFDQESAHPNLVFSRDLTGVTETDIPQVVSNSSKRFLQCVNVLASETFESGRHYWEVWVGNKIKWDLGVAAESVDRKAKVKLCPENGYWTLRLRNRNEYSAMTSPLVRLSLENCPRKVGVYLDCGEQKVAFYNAEDMVHLFTFTQADAHRFCPFFSTCFSEGHQNVEPMRICHLNL
ncbi:zinc-binding protein A33 [Microcaecilia unicolor]|uniref:Zinc-binding protein A33-like n=1 Tax=Microcaecilia unicolor TaxID=1415580 RepID=A0A6P7YNJ6_9AMPH|nr:zinc-binding protein A33-like [Microcaecilia unicolor]